MSAYRPTQRTLIDVLEGAAARYGGQPAVRLRHDDGTIMTWSYRELDRRSRLVAWRLRSRGLMPGHRLLTWSPSGPELAAVYFGAMRAGVIYVPLDLTMAPDAIRRIADMRCWRIASKTTRGLRLRMYRMSAPRSSVR